MTNLSAKVMYNNMLKLQTAPLKGMHNNMLKLQAAPLTTTTACPARQKSMHGTGLQVQTMLCLAACLLELDISRLVSQISKSLQNRLTVGRQAI